MITNLHQILFNVFDKQAYEENSPKKHPLNTIDPAAVERLCCSSIQLTV